MQYSSQSKGWALLSQHRSEINSDCLPSFKADLSGGHLAVYGEGSTESLAHALPWLVFHGGPGGRITPDLVAPFREAGLGWFGFDQRNSGSSEDFPLQAIDLQTGVDDATQVADCLDFDRFNVCGGSWGALLALVFASQNLTTVKRLVLRAPFIPFFDRVDHFFEQLEQLATDYYFEAFGDDARTFEVCSQVLYQEYPDRQIRAALAWSELEQVALGIRRVENLTPVQNFESKSQWERAKALRKYSVQSHFLLNDCFYPEQTFFQDLNKIANSEIEVVILQGASDIICPADGTLMLQEHLPQAHVQVIQGCGHRAGEQPMKQAFAQALR